MTLTPYTRYEGPNWSGVLAYVGPDTWGESDESYAYFIDGELGGVPQRSFGLPLSRAVAEIAERNT